MSAREEKLHLEHDKAGRKLYGVKRWQNANFGWCTDFDTITSKVYGNAKNPTELFISCIDKNGLVRHETDLY